MHHYTRIQPRIQRIVWLYKRWQPLYAIIKSTVTPRVEFIQGIPQELDDDDYFNPRQNNLLILDDMMSTVGKDKRITDLFTEGSHHRSLSIISINQNLYATKDPTQRRNCHYLILYDNPVDKSMTFALARQMFPKNSEQFIKSFEKATKRPYGFLLLDLKPFTPANQRLKYDIVWNDKYPEPIKGVHLDSIGHYSSGVRTDHIEETEENNTIKSETPNQIDYFSAEVGADHIAENLEEVTLFKDAMADNQNSCDSCGLLFDTPHDVQRHIKRGWCPECNDEPQAKKRKLDENSDNELDDNLDENTAFLQLWKMAKTLNKKRFNKMVDQLIKDGEEEEEAKEIAEDRIRSYEERTFFEKYELCLDDYLFPLQTSRLHKTIVSNVERLISKGLKQTSAIKRSLRKYRGEFQDLFDTDFSDSEESDDENDEDESEDDDDDSEEKNE